MTAETPPIEYAVAVAAAALCTGACRLLSPYLEPINLVMVYLLGAMLVAMRGRRIPAALFSVLAVLCFDFFFVPPRLSFRVADGQYLATFAAMLAVSLVVSGLALRLREKADAALRDERGIASRHALSQRLAGTRGVEATLQTGTRHLAEIFDSEVAALIPGPGGRLAPRAWSGETRSFDEKDISVAQWVYASGRPAGIGTRALPVSNALYAPLSGSSGPIGVLRIEPRSAERLRSSLLSAVSHDLKTPLAAILGAALESLSRQLGDRPVRADMPEELPLVPLDAVLLQQVFINLIENAIRHAPGAGPIDISARHEAGLVAVEVSDRGPGLPAEDLERAFDKFHRGASGGAGLGLAICRAVVEAHRGSISARNREGGGAVFRFTLPLREGP